MMRRRRRPREIPFSFDSFLDVVANVVGIIIRLILVVWVGARSYSSIQALAKPAKPTVAVSAGTTVPEDPLQQELARHRQELAAVEARLLEQLRQLDLTKETERKAEGDLTTLLVRRDELEKEQLGTEQAKAEREQSGPYAALSLDELRQRQAKVLEEIRAVEKLPAAKKVLRYRTPVSQPVHTEEFFFECRQGRVTFIDVASLLEEVRQSMEGKTDQLRRQWQVADTTPPVGAFRLRFTIERERAALDNVFASPLESGGFRYGLSEWVVEPVTADRGETIEQALAEGSKFRRLADTLDAQAVVTFWIYPDSFAIYRKLRDYLYDRDVSVAGRPLPEGVPIACTRKGSASRAQ